MRPPRGPSGGALLAAAPLPHFLGPLPSFTVSLPSPNFEVARKRAPKRDVPPSEGRAPTPTAAPALPLFSRPGRPARGGLRTPARRTAQARAAGPNPDPGPRTPPWARTPTSVWDSGPWTRLTSPDADRRPEPRPGPHPGPTTTDPEARIPEPSPEARTRGPGAAPQRRTPDLRRRTADLRPPPARPPPAGCPPPPPPTPPGRGRKTRPGGGWGRGGPGGRPGDRMWGRRGPGRGPGRDLGLGARAAALTSGLVPPDAPAPRRLGRRSRRWSRSGRSAGAAAGALARLGPVPRRLLHSAPAPAAAASVRPQTPPAIGMGAAPLSAASGNPTAASPRTPRACTAGRGPGARARFLPAPAPRACASRLKEPRRCLEEP